MKIKKHLLAYNKLSRLPVLDHARIATSKTQAYNPLSMFAASAIWGWICSYLRYAFQRRHKFLDASAAPNGRRASDRREQLSH